MFFESKSIAQGGKKYCISTFIGHYEVSARWESGTGAIMADDIARLMGIITFVVMMDRTRVRLWHAYRTRLQDFIISQRIQFIIMFIFLRRVHDRSVHTGMGQSQGKQR